MHIHYKPEDGWTGDFIPFFWQGEYHLFYLKDFRDPVHHGEGTPWYHLVTSDFVHFQDFGECLPRGTAEEQDLYVFTGSVIHAQDQFHIFYTGHNPYFRKQGRPEQAVMHAVSDDLYHWQKVPLDTFYAPVNTYEPHDWRDPFVFWNPEENVYCMLLAARLKDGPSRRRGCTALCVSQDLAKWEVREPLYAPAQYFTHECPDLFRINDWWYLIFSEFSEACLTRYRMARSLAGPWHIPSVDSFDTRAFYAAKTATDGSQHYLFGWNPTRANNTDTGTWQWGGNLVVHKLVQQADGCLGVQMPESIRKYFCQTIPVQPGASENLTLHAKDMYRFKDMGELPDPARIEITIQFQNPIQTFGILLHSSPDSETGYIIRFEPVRSRVVFDCWPRPGDQPFLTGMEQHLDQKLGMPIHLEIILNGSLGVIYLNHQAALSMRMYDHPTGNWGFFATAGSVSFSNIALYGSGQ